MIKKFTKNLLILNLIVLWIFSILPFVKTVNAVENYKITISRKDQLKDIDFQAEPLSYVLWKVDEGADVERLNSKTDEELTKIYGNPDLKNEENSYVTDIKVQNKGTYYIRGNNRVGKTQINPLLISLPYLGKNEVTVFVKTTIDEVFGELLINKVDQNNKPLKDVEFELFKYTSSGLANVFTDKDYNANGFDLNVKTFITDDKGQIKITNLKPGDYVLKETKALKGYAVNVEDSNINIKPEKTTTIKVVNYEKKFGNKNFMKVSSEDKNLKLEGATFKVFKVIENKEVPVTKNGADYLVTSNEKGEFSVENLPYGKYTLWETKSPKGYLLLENKVDFEIKEDSQSDTVLVIENKPKGSIIMPKTGDIKIYILITIGLLFIVSGSIIKFKNRK